MFVFNTSDSLDDSIDYTRTMISIFNILASHGREPDMMSDWDWKFERKIKNDFRKRNMDSDFDCDEYDEYESDSEEYESESENVALIATNEKPTKAAYDLLQRNNVYSIMDENLQSLQGITGLSYVSFILAKKVQRVFDVISIF